MLKTPCLKSYHSRVKMLEFNNSAFLHQHSE
jgi:hypothetical protein